MYREIGEEFKFTEFQSESAETIVRLIVEHSITCKGCYLEGCCKDLGSERLRETCGSCSSIFRGDHKSVIFKKINWINLELFLYIHVTSKT